MPFLAVAVGVVVLDQVTKWLMASSFSPHETKNIIDGIFNLTYITNTGAAFGILRGGERWRHIFFQLVSFLALGGLFYLYKTLERDSKLIFWGLALVFGGALGNLVDRLRYGYVVDFLDFHINGYHWPAFNIADSAITIGVSLLIFSLIISKN